MGKVGVITGASSGIGRATAEHFARHGYSLAVIARREALLTTLVDSLKQQYPDAKFVAYAGDVSSWSDVDAIAKKIESDWPCVNVLINNAGAFDYAPLEKATPEKIDEMIHVNVRGVIAMCRALLPSLRKAVGLGGARIINVSSIAGLWGFPSMAAYSATKFAVAGFGSALDRELVKQGISVSTIFPGPVNTKLARGSRPEKKMVKVPDDIAKELLALAEGKRKKAVHPVFGALSLLEQVSSTTVDKILKKIL